ncbi:putative oxidoreductase YqkF [Flavobacterium suaedae]|uniref:Oxidoreductase YqkF n=1 Tax=Flavobacterium suaedae TaxID=1767027 RepID=A0ABQ1JXP3_9FLAO|nr:aldo/keto reductase [Flavobacterium suaedae]GGB81542.1 putative oxidoreductase YqkF [Flavobacterium suaedae]
MRYKNLKRANFKVSELSFGCMSLKSDVTENDKLINKAIDSDINLFDTADLYEGGENERLLGNALKGKRNDILIATKVGNRMHEDGSGWDWCPEKEYILSAVDKSLQRLQTDYIDLYLLHGGTINDPTDEVIEAFERLLEQGKIRAYGISSIRPNVIREYIEKSNIAAVMTQYSLLDRRPEEETLRLLESNEIGVLARGTVAGGLLAGKPAKEYLGIPADEIAKIVNAIQSTLPERSVNEKAMRYVMDNTAITTAVAGIRTEQQLLDAIAAEKSTSLTAVELQQLKSIWKGTIYQNHR